MDFRGTEKSFVKIMNYLSLTRNFCDFQWATCHCGNVRKYKPFLAFLSKVSHSFSAHDFAKAIFMLNCNDLFLCYIFTKM